jgi:ABC-2 type transport system ATP-binding protein
MGILEFHNIKKRFKSNLVLSDVSFNVNEGEIFGIAGISGSGKSVLLKILLGLLNEDEGKIFFRDRDVTWKKNYLRRNTGFASQGNMLFDELTIKENSYYFGKLYGMKRSNINERFNELINLMELSNFGNIKIKHLSGGMKKRANLMVALIHKPQLLILDEPTVGLDNILREKLWNYIKKVNLEGVTIIVTTHLLDEIQENCNSLAILKHGNIVSIGSFEQYKQDFKINSFGDIFKYIIENETI